MFYGYVNIIRISHGNVSTFSVHQLVSLCPPVGLLVPVTRASAAHHVGIGRPCAGQLLPIAWATSAQIWDLFGSFHDTSMILLSAFFEKSH